MPRVFVTKPGPFAKPDISAAREFGTLVYLPTPVQYNRLVRGDSSALVDQLVDFLRDFRRGDYLLPMGMPVTMAMAVAVAQSQIGNAPVPVLEWDGRSGAYDVITVRLPFIPVAA